MSILANGNSKPWIGAVAVTIAAGALYFLTAARDIVVGDSPELITAAATLGVAHAPGYPLFTMLGHAFSLLPFGSIPFRVNLLSVVCNALTVGVIYVTAFRLTMSQLAAVVAALLLTVNRNFWSWSLAAEVFPLNNLLAALLILLLTTWHEQPERRALLIAGFFVAGLAMTNHQTIVLLAPSFCLLLWQRRSILRGQALTVTLGIAAFTIALLPYLYVPWASAHHPVYNWGNVSSLNDLFGLITRRNYGATRLVSAPSYTGGSPSARLAALSLSFGLFPGLLILLGAIQTYRSQRWYFWFNVTAFVFAGPLFVWITNLNLTAAPSALFVLQRFFLLSQVLLAPLVAFGVLMLTRLLARSMSSTESFALRLVSAASLAAVAITVATNYRDLDQSRNFIARRFGEDIFATARPRSILLVRGDGLAFPLMYLQEVEKLGNDKTLIVLPFLLGDWYAQQLREKNPDLVIPFQRYNQNNVDQLVEANPGRAITIVGTLGDDHSLDASYWPYQQGLLTAIMPKSKNISMETLLAQNEELLRRVHPPAPATIRANTFEADIFSVYSYPAFGIANACEQAGLKDAARIWYQRALAINPKFGKAQEALTRLEP